MTPAMIVAVLLSRDLESDMDKVDAVIARGRIASLEDVLPRGDAELLRLLGDPRYIVRELAAAELARRGAAASLALAWGCRVRDVSIAGRSRSLRERLFACPACDSAKNYCPACRWMPPDSGCPWGCEWKPACWGCDGTADVRMHFGPGGVIEPRNVIAREVP